MAKMLICTIFLFVTVSLFSQQTNSSQLSINQNYLRKSKNQKTAAWILLAGGAVLLTTGALVGNNEEASFDDAATGAIIAGAGLLSAITSIPLFIASRRNKKKAMKVSTYLEMRRNPVKTGTTSGIGSSFVAFSLKLNL